MGERIYLVTGAAGFLGSTLVQKLVRQGRTVRGLILDPRERERFSTLPVEWHCGDLRKPESLRALFRNPEHRELIVLHTAGRVSIASKADRELYEVNVLGTRNLLSLCKRHEVGRMIHVSSVHAIPELPAGQLQREVTVFSPDAVRGGYAKTKAQASELVLESARAGLDCCVVYPSGILGPGDYGKTHINRLVLENLDGRLKACVAGGYDFVDVSDVADGILCCVDRGVCGEGYILSNRYCSLRDFLELLHTISGGPRTVVTLPFWLARATAPLAERYARLRHRPPLYTPYSLDTLQSNALFSHQRATEQLGYHPRPLEATLRDTVAWMRAQQAALEPKPR
ncbi:MAG: NAD-dependent epimerase/dehydratase family protein [Oscillospiraceae bacterium]